MKRALLLLLPWATLAGTAVAVAAALVDCGGDSATSTSDVDAGGGGGGRDAALGDAAGGGEGGPGCAADAPCGTNPGAPCRNGRTTCTGGQAQCVDGPPAQDGTVCSAGLCAHGSCLGEATVTTSVDLSAASVTAGRSCAAEAPSFVVTALTSTQATVATAPTGDCLASGDEVMLIDLQGSTGATANVGNWELLDVASVQGANVTFVNAKTRSYGASADSSIGTGATDQKVVLVRVPRFGTLTIATGGTLTTSAWNGSQGGVLALRAAKLTVDGTITAAGLGYRNGQWSRDDSSCSDNVVTESGESIDGPSVASTSNHAGAPGGLGDEVSTSFNGSTPENSGAGHATAGQTGVNGNGRTVGAPGGTYGANDATKLTMGSGASGNLTCESGFPGPALVVIDQPLAGGIVALFADRVSIAPGGSVTAAALTASRDVSASGGYVFIRGTTVDVGIGLVSAVGGAAPSGSPPTSGTMIASGDGYVVLQGTTITGTTTPAAHQL